MDVIVNSHNTCSCVRGLHVRIDQVGLTRLIALSVDFIKSNQYCFHLDYGKDHSNNEDDWIMGYIYFLLYLYADTCSNTVYV